MDYVFQYHSQLMTKEESCARCIRILKFKHAHSLKLFRQHRKPLTPEQERAKWAEDMEFGCKSCIALENTPAVQKLVAMKRIDFFRTVTKRILEAHGQTLEFNRCPKCNGVARTPTARQCQHCFHSWRDQ